MEKQERKENKSNNQNKLILMSDIHSRSAGLKEALDSGYNNIIILGDLFDRGEETIKVFDLVMNNLDKITLIRGNHDDLLFKAFELETDNNQLKLLFMANDYKNWTYKSIMNHLTNKQILGGFNPREELFYIQDIYKNYPELKTKLEEFKNQFIKYTTFNYKDKTIRLSHTGNFYNTTTDFDYLWGLDPTLALIDYRKENNIIDVSGHWVFAHLESFLQENNLVPIHAYIDNVIYVPSWNQIFIDDGTGENIVDIEEIMRKIDNNEFEIESYHSQKYILRDEERNKKLKNK